MERLSLEDHHGGVHHTQFVEHSVTINEQDMTETVYEEVTAGLEADIDSSGITPPSHGEEEKVPAKKKQKKKKGTTDTTAAAGGGYNLRIRIKEF